MFGLIFSNKKENDIEIRADVALCNKFRQSPLLNGEIHLKGASTKWTYSARKNLMLKSYFIRKQIVVTSSYAFQIRKDAYFYGTSWERIWEILLKKISSKLADLDKEISKEILLNFG